MERMCLTSVLKLLPDNRTTEKQHGTIDYATDFNLFMHDQDGRLTQQISAVTADVNYFIDLSDPSIDFNVSEEAVSFDDGLVLAEGDRWNIRLPN